MSVAKNAASAGGAIGAGLVLSLLMATSAHAAESSPRRNEFEITPFVGTMGGGKFEDATDGSNRDLESDTDYGIIFDANADSYERQYELVYTRQSTSVQGTEPLDMGIQYLHIGGIVNFTDESRHVIPFFGLTVGGTRFEPDAAGLDSATKLSFSVAGGMKIPVTEHIGIRLDARAFVTVMNSDANIFCGSGSAGGTCLIKSQSDTFVQYTIGLGVIAGF
ncbi:MAG TPA: outer membrane beta-barrel protein [Steroidobacteraceae bacterium]